MTPAEYKQLNDKLDMILKMLRSQTGGEVADDRDLDSQYGDPIVKFDLRPEDWHGPSMVGLTFSQCPVEWLDAKAASDANYAEYLRGEKKGTPEDVKKANYRDKDAARARGWARRLRNGWRPTNAAPPRTQGTTSYGATAQSPPATAQAPAKGYGSGASYGRDNPGGYGQRTNLDADTVGGGAPADGVGFGATDTWGGTDEDIPFIFIDTRFGRP